MKIDKIKPIPKYITKLIKKYDSKYQVYCEGRTRFYAYLTKNCGELVKVTVAVKERYKKMYFKQVAVHGIHSEDCFVRDMAFSYIPGYLVGWYDMGIAKYQKWYEDGKWYFALDKLYDPFAPVVNMDYLYKHFPQYKYSAIELYGGDKIFKYLRLYEEYPQMEYIMKLGLDNLVLSKQILRLAGKEKTFRKWLARNRQELRDSDILVSTVLTAYKENKSIRSVQAFLKAKQDLIHNDRLKPIREFFKKDLERFFSYIGEQKTNANSYRDYLDACNYLGLDMTIDKNRYPHDFKRWHDIRIDEYKTAKALKEEEERKEWYEQFESVAQKYLKLQYDKKAEYVAIIAKNPTDLINEGKQLHHCVGSMNYDRRFIREESLIFFIRMKDAPTVPLVTIEYSLSQKKVLQCYGDHDTKPSEDILNFVHKKWLPYANRQLTKVAA